MRVVAPNFVAGFDVVDGRVTITAPILKKLRGLTADQARAYIRQRGWYAHIVTTPA